jgi:hypothetical protein
VTFPVLASNGPSGYNLTRSLRLRASASAYLSRTPASAGNRQKFTVSVWYKAGIISTGLVNANILSCGDGSSLLISGSGAFGSTVNDRLIFRDNGGATTLYWPTVFRDTGSWYHIVFAMDTTQSTAANRAKLYVNGVDQGSFSGSAPAQNTNTTINSTSIHTINTFNGTFYPSDLYYAEYNFIDGQQLTASSFGSTNTLTGVWQPAQYSGTYGTNGFYLPFTDNSALTTSSNVGLGKDFSGNGNYWTTNNISITAGTTYDSMTDVPTLTSATAANFCVLNPLSTTAGTYSNANLRYVGASAWRRTNSTIAVNSGKWYWEVKLGNAPYTPKGSNTSYNAFGFGLSTVFNSTTTSSAVTDAIILADNGYYKNFSGAFTDSGLTFVSGDVLSVAVDLTANTFTFYRNNSSVVTGTIGVTAGTTLTPFVLSYDGTYGVMDANFGQRPFTYTPPTGYVALNTYNLPDSTIVKGNTVMDATLYTGNSSTQTVTNAGAFEPDLVWIKNRSATSQHVWTDSVRGVTKQLFSSNTNAEQTSATGITSFNSNGFTTGANPQPTGDTNSSPNSFVAWQWLESASAGFDIVTFTGNGGSQTFAHGLGVAPGLMICKSLNNAQDWYVYHRSIGGTGALLLNSAAGTQTSVNYWANVTPGSSTFSVGPNFSNGYTYINYLFAPIAGFSAFGSYVGNGSSDGPFVYVGFRPRFVMIKNATGYNWVLYDTARNPYNVTNWLLAPNTSTEESNSISFPCAIDILSNGFKTRNYDATYGPNTNSSGVTYVYACFAENPFKNALAR